MLFVCSILILLKELWNKCCNVDIFKVDLPSAGQPDIVIAKEEKRKKCGRPKKNVRHVGFLFRGKRQDINRVNKTK